MGKGEAVAAKKSVCGALTLGRLGRLHPRRAESFAFAVGFLSIQEI
jgi:hypothetical protein